MTTFQQQQALNLANRVRAERARLKREIHRLPANEGRALLADVLAENPVAVRGVKTAVAVMWPRCTQ